MSLDTTQDEQILNVSQNSSKAGNCKLYNYDNDELFTYSVVN